MTKTLPLDPRMAARNAWLAVAAALVVLGFGCQSSTKAGGAGGTASSGGTVTTGGSLGSAGTTGTAGTGAGLATGGSPGSGGTTSTGGVTGSGGTSGTTSSGGATTRNGGTSGPAGTGGVTATGGSTTSSGGTSGTGGNRTGGTSGTISSGGTTTRTGGATGTGGTTGTGGARTGGTTSGTGGATGGATGTGGTTTALPAAADILAILKKVIPYEIKLGPEDPSWVNKWTEATFYIGVMAAYLATGDSTYLDDATTWATNNKWTLLGSPTRSADNQCAGQVYADIYLTNPVSANANMVANLKTNIDAMVASPKPGISQSAGDDWWWCDALFMAPGAVSRLGKITGDAKYASFLDTMWSGTQTGLFDTKTGLFWRDSTFVNGSVYWSRGNGWVMAGIVRVLQYLPATDANHAAYVNLLGTMAAAVAKLQQADGTWHADLTHPATYNNPEVSGTGLLTYAIAWGINQGLLDRATYLPVIAAAWQAMTGCVDSQGRVGYIQATGSAPAAATATETHDYGVGAFVLAASEMYLLVK